jgi:hypothetical protein
MATVLGTRIATLLTGSFVIEQMFAMPGIGRYFMQAISNRDYPMIMGVTIYFSVILLVCMLLVDIVYGWLDPRVAVYKKRELEVSMELEAVAPEDWAPAGARPAAGASGMRKSLSYWGDVWRRLKQNKLSIFGLFVVFALIFTALLGPALTGATDSDQNRDYIHIPPLLDLYRPDGSTFVYLSPAMQLFEVSGDGR